MGLYCLQFPKAGTGAVNQPRAALKILAKQSPKEHISVLREFTGNSFLILPRFFKATQFIQMLVRSGCLTTWWFLRISSRQVKSKHVTLRMCKWCVFFGVGRLQMLFCKIRLCKFNPACQRLVRIEV